MEANGDEIRGIQDQRSIRGTSDHEPVENQVIVSCIELEDSKHRSLGVNNEQIEGENTTQPNIDTDEIRLIRGRMNYRTFRSDSFTKKRLDRPMIHTNSEGQFGSPLKTVFFPDTGPTSEKSIDCIEKSGSRIDVLLSAQSPPFSVPTISLSNAIQQSFKKLQVQLDDTEKDPLFQKKPKQSIDIWESIGGAMQFTIPEFSIFFKFWNIFINLMHILNLVITPVLFGWFVQFMSIRWVICFLCLDIVFLIDCYLRAHLSFTDEYGIQITDVRATIKRYLVSNWGWVDLVSSLPLDLLVFSSNWGVNSFKAWAIIRFVKLILRFPYMGLFNSQVPRVALPISRLIKTMVVLLLLGHIDGCLFWFLESCLSPPRWIDKEYLAEAVFSTQYLVSYISALKSLVLKLRSAYKDGENIYVVFEFIAGILAYGTVFGNIHSIVEMMDDTVISSQAEERHKFEMDRLRQYMREKGIIPELQKMVNSHKELQWMRSQGVDEAKLFDDLPKSLQQEIKNFLYLDLVKKVPLFQDTDIQFQYSVSLKIKPIHIIEGCFIFRKDDEGQEMFFIKSGQVEILGDSGQIFVTLGTGSFFGEIALFKNCKRTASARAKGNVELCMLTKDDYNFILTQFPIISERIQRTIKEREENEMRKKAEQAALEAAKKLEEEREAQAKLARELHPKSSIFGSIASLASSIRDQRQSVSNMASKQDINPHRHAARSPSFRASTTHQPFLTTPGRQRSSSFAKS